MIGRRAAIKGLVAMAAGPRARYGPTQTDGLIRPLGAPSGAGAVPGIQPGVTNGVIQARQVIVFGIGDGVYVYPAGTVPRLGNPPISWESAGQVDPFGNVLPSTTGVAGAGTFQAGNTVIKTLGEFIYSGAPAAGNLIASLTPASGTNDGLTNPYARGVNAYVVVGGVTYAIGLNQTGAFGFPGVSIEDIANPPAVPAGMFASASNGATKLARAYVISGSVTGPDIASAVRLASATDSGTANGLIEILAGLTQVGATGTLEVNDNTGTVTLANPLLSNPATPGSGGALYSDTNNDVAAINGGGAWGALPMVQTDSSTISSGNVTAKTAITIGYGVQSNVIGTIYELTTWFNGTWGGQLLTFYAGITGAWTQVGQSIGAIFGAGVASGDQVAGWAKLVCQVVSLTTMRIHLEGTIFDTSQNAGHTSTSTQVALGGTVATGVAFAAGNVLSIAVAFGAAAAGQTIQTFGSKLEIIPP